MSERRKKTNKCVRNTAIAVSRRRKTRILSHRCSHVCLTFIRAHTPKLPSMDHFIRFCFFGCAWKRTVFKTIYSLRWDVTCNSMNTVSRTIYLVFSVFLRCIIHNHMRKWLVGSYNFTNLFATERTIRIWHNNKWIRSHDIEQKRFFNPIHSLLLTIYIYYSITITVTSRSLSLSLNLMFASVWQQIIYN